MKNIIKTIILFVMFLNGTIVIFSQNLPVNKFKEGHSAKSFHSYCKKKMRNGGFNLGYRQYHFLNKTYGDNLKSKIILPRAGFGLGLDYVIYPIRTSFEWSYQDIRYKDVDKGTYLNSVKLSLDYFIPLYSNFFSKFLHPYFGILYNYLIFEEDYNSLYYLFDVPEHGILGNSHEFSHSKGMARFGVVLFNGNYKIDAYYSRSLVPSGRHNSPIVETGISLLAYIEN